MTVKPARRRTPSRPARKPELQDQFLPPPASGGVDPTAADQDMLGYGTHPGVPYPLVQVRDIKGVYSLATPDGMVTLQPGMDWIVYGDYEVSALVQMGAMTVGHEVSREQYQAFMADQDVEDDAAGE